MSVARLAAGEFGEHWSLAVVEPSRNSPRKVRENELAGQDELEVPNDLCLVRSSYASSLAHSKSNTFRVPWAQFKSLDPFTHICPPFSYSHLVAHTCL